MARLVDLNKQLGGTIAQELEAIFVGPVDARPMGEFENIVGTNTEYRHLAAESGLTGISAGGNIDLVKYYFRLPHCESYIEFLLLEMGIMLGRVYLNGTVIFRDI